MSIARIWPWTCAFLLAALAPAVIAAVLMGIAAFPLAFVITLGHAIILGLPVALFYRAKRWTRLEATLAGSFMIGAIPAGVVNWPTINASVAGIPTTAGGISTVALWVHYFEGFAIFGGFGALGGLVFWITLKRFGILKKIEPVT